jgi:hypothetical protein
MGVVGCVAIVAALALYAFGRQQSLAVRMEVADAR